MTLIICKRIDCMYIKQRVDKDYQCGRIYIGIGQDKKCDTYMQMPEQAVEVDAEKLCKICGQGQGISHNNCIIIGMHR